MHQLVFYSGHLILFYLVPLKPINCVVVAAILWLFFCFCDYFFHFFFFVRQHMFLYTCMYIYYMATSFKLQSGLDILQKFIYEIKCRRARNCARETGTETEIQIHSDSLRYLLHSLYLRYRAFDWMSCLSFSVSVTRRQIAMLLTWISISNCINIGFGLDSASPYCAPPLLTILVRSRKP